MRGAVNLDYHAFIQQGEIHDSPDLPDRVLGAISHPE